MHCKYMYNREINHLRRSSMKYQGFTRHTSRFKDQQPGCLTRDTPIISKPTTSPVFITYRSLRNDGPQFLYIRAETFKLPWVVPVRAQFNPAVDTHNMASNFEVIPPLPNNQSLTLKIGEFNPAIKPHEQNVRNPSTTPSDVIYQASFCSLRPRVTTSHVHLNFPHTSSSLVFLTKTTPQAFTPQLKQTYIDNNPPPRTTNQSRFLSSLSPPPYRTSGLTVQNSPPLGYISLWAHKQIQAGLGILIIMLSDQIQFARKIRFLHPHVHVSRGDFPPLPAKPSQADSYLGYRVCLQQQNHHICLVDPNCTVSRPPVLLPVLSKASRVKQASQCVQLDVDYSTRSNRDNKYL